MAINVNCYDVEKYWLKWLRVLDCVERIWVRVLSMPIVCYLIDYCFNNYLIMVSDNMVLEF